MNLGVLGAGQLGRMLALAGYPLGMRFRFLDPGPRAPAGRLAEQWVGPYEDERLLQEFAQGLDAVTYEFENVPTRAAAFLAERVPLFPGVAALHAAQDRIHEKEFFRAHGIPTAEFAAIDSEEALQRALKVTGLPAVLKTRRMGYDGKGQQVVRTREDAEAARQNLGGAWLILEQCIPFTREVSLIAVRSVRGEAAFYPLIENHHRDGLLRLSLAPAPGIGLDLQRQAEAHAMRLLEALDYIGVLTIEFFQVHDELLANEMAPRVHNSGHWTIEGARTSQFANHLRAGLGLPLGDCSCRCAAAMWNLIGEAPPLEALLQLPNVHPHLYDKAPVPGRKLGHVTVTGQDHDSLRDSLQRLQALSPAAPGG